MTYHLCPPVPNRRPLFLPHGPRNSYEAAHDLRIAISTLDALSLSPRLNVFLPLHYGRNSSTHTLFRPELLDLWPLHRPQIVDLLACCEIEAADRWGANHREENPRLPPYRAESWGAALAAYEETDPGLQEANAIFLWWNITRDGRRGR